MTEQTQSPSCGERISKSSSRKRTRKLPVLEFMPARRGGLLRRRLRYKDNRLIDVWHNGYGTYEVYLDLLDGNRYSDTECIARDCDLIEATCLVYQLLAE
jgi:hypothetical protein